jgi:hypothetical protein
VTAATDTHITIEELLEAVFSVESEQGLCKESQLDMVLDKEKPCIGSIIRCLNLAVVKPATVQLTRSVSEWLH